MATVNRSTNGRPTAKVLAKLDGVQAVLDAYTFEIAARASALLEEHRFEGHSEIQVEKGGVDRYVILSDDRGQKAALSIEYGRQAYEQELPSGDTIWVGAMDGLFILHRAAKIPKARRAKVKM